MKRNKISDEERRKQDEITQRIEELETELNSLREQRRCRYCGDKWYCAGYCVCCYHILRSGGDLDSYTHFDSSEKRRKEKVVVKRKQNWRLYMWEHVHKGVMCDLNEDELEKWTDWVWNVLSFTEWPVFKNVFEERNSIRYTAKVMESSRGKIMAQLESGYKRILKAEKERKQNNDSEK